LAPAPRKIGMRVLRKDGARLAFWVGVLLPIPVFFEFSQGLPRLASGEGTALPVGLLLIVPILLYLARRPRQIGYLAERNVAVLAITVITAGLILASAVVSIRGSLPQTAFAFQWSLPLVYAIFGFVSAQRASDTTSLAKGLAVGTTIAVGFVLAAWVVDWEHFATFGRINQFDPPVPGMYQVGNYTPTGLLLTGCVTLALVGKLPPSLRRYSQLLGWCSLISAALLFGAREVLVSAGLIAVMGCALLVRTARGMTRLLLIPVLLVPVATSIGINRVASIERFRTGSGSRGLLAGREATVADRGFGLFDGSTSLLGELATGASLDSSGRVSRLSSHNSYLDLTIDFGLLGLALAVALIMLFVGLGVRSWLTAASGVGRGGDPAAPVAAFWLSAAVVSFGLVAANVNLPLAQPYSAAIGYLALGLLAGQHGNLRRTRTIQPNYRQVRC
jgi:hypothetical protein